MSDMSRQLVLSDAEIYTRCSERCEMTNQGLVLTDDGRTGQSGETRIAITSGIAAGAARSAGAAGPLLCKAGCRRKG